MQNSAEDPSEQSEQVSSVFSANSAHAVLGAAMSRQANALSWHFQKHLDIHGTLVAADESLLPIRHSRQ